ncbi:unnamed protein product [Dibothriocephalus latus]|uniref:RBR-type E3 ubiquitin transferase n=1 Tax=Dibothriocephalus latus TaxID=60516 RepID=A0A3P7LWK1_DIBLA|nr:unnamed protein product [Dibothriocephalus latus]
MFMDLVSARLTEEIGMFTGDFVVKHCCEFLEKEVVDYLFRTSPDAPISIDLFEYAELEEPSDDAEGGDMIYRLTDLAVSHEEQLRNHEFADATQQCPICFDELPGTQCIRFRKCRHVACRNCAADHFATQIEQGANACQPTCVSCAETVRQQEIRAVVTEELYAAYERRLLNLTLSNMPDMVLCPNRDCNNQHVMLNENRDQGVCPSCRFHFCARCMAAFHDKSPCKTGPLRGLSPDQGWSRYLLFVYTYTFRCRVYCVDFPD